jgi:L-lactate dehydrogenase complex protein LldG
VTSDERRAMRDAIAHALGTADLPAGGAEHPGVFAGATVPVFEESFIERFRRELEALGGVVHEARSADDIAEIVQSLAASEGGSDVLAWDDETLPVSGVSGALAARGLTVIHQRPGGAQEPQARARWERAVVGVTGAAAALAETGSVVVVSGPGRGRLASLLPPIHVALVRRRSLTRSLPMLLAAESGLATSGTNMVVITGPSRTADIEHTLSRGVHGPREIHVILVD